MKLTNALLDQHFTPTIRQWENYTLLSVVRVGTSNRRNSGRYTTGTKLHLVRVEYVIDVEGPVEPKTIGASWVKMRDDAIEGYGKPWYYDVDPVVFSCAAFCYTNGQQVGAPLRGEGHEVTCAKCLPCVPQPEPPKPKRQYSSKSTVDLKRVRGMRRETLQARATELSDTRLSHGIEDAEWCIEHHLSIEYYQTKLDIYKAEQARRAAAKKPTPYDLVGNIIAFESGELDTRGTLELFSHLIKTGQAWSLQGSYGRAATRLIENGMIDRDGTIHEVAQ